MSTNGIIINSINQIIATIHYKIKRKLDEGMFSTVKLATHSLTGEQVAVKILEKTKITKIEDKERINHEIEIMKLLNHFNIAKLYQVVEKKLTIYLIQEYIQGKEFIDYLNKKGKLKEIEACKFYHQIISGLEYIHQCGIAHRDFKPENILLTNNNTILKIIDFGLSNLYKNDELLKTACGSPCYAPPEMIKEEHYDGGLSDIWSSGIILYLMLCGKLPFYHEQNEIMYQQILSGKFELPDFLSDNAKDILTKIIEIDPKKRLNFGQIKEHPWFNIIDKNEFLHKGIIINEDIIPVDEEIIQKMEKMGFNKMEVRYNIIKNFHNKITTVYDILLKKKIENGKKSIGDMNSDLFDEYINDKKNKINFYGSLENVLKNRICDNGKKINILPNYFEDKYDDNNEDIIVGDTGSVIERLIKAGKFTYDEEKMCLNRVSSLNKNLTRKDHQKENDDDGDSKFKNISELKTSKPKKVKKLIIEDIIDEKKDNSIVNRQHTQIEQPKISLKKTPNILNTSTNNKKYKKLITFNNHENINMKDKEKRKKVEKKEKEKEIKIEDNNDWYKEIERMIVGEISTPKKKRPSSAQKRKPKEEEIKKTIIYKDNSKLKKIAFLNKNIKTSKIGNKNNVNNNDKKKFKFNYEYIKKKSKLNNEPLKTSSNIKTVRHRKNMSTKMDTNKSFMILDKKYKKLEKKLGNINQSFEKNNVKTNKNIFQSCKTTKYVKKIKNEEKSSLKKKNYKPKIKIEIHDDSQDETIDKNFGNRKRQSCKKRVVKTEKI